jgi:sialate O-acetylesterase
MADPQAPATLKLPHIFSDRMMIQRDVPAPIWGWGAPGQSVTVTLAAHRVTAPIDADGRWKVSLPPSPAGGPHDLTVRSGEQTVRIADVLIGEVWLCSGQSNMEWTLNANGNLADADIAAADDPALRFFTVAKNTAAAPIDDVSGEWFAAHPKIIGECSAVAYYMARELRKTLGIPVGLIVSSWGGTAAEAWVPPESLQSTDVLRPIAKRIVPPEHLAELKPYEDPGNEGVKLGYAEMDHADGDWKTMDLPRFWESTGLNIDGSVWFRREFDLPTNWAGKELSLSLGALDDFDTTYINGVEIGRTGKETRNHWSHPRVYPVPASVLRAGRNVIAVRIFDQWGNGGFAGKSEQLFLAGPGGQIPLSGDWKFKIELELPPAPMSAATPPTSLFNAMIAPLIGYAIRGAAWYQGESNVDRGFQYRTLLTTLIQCWRQAWNQGNFPFLIVQLANFHREDANYPNGVHWAELREAQALAATALPKVGLALAIDIGEAEDIHPKNKWDVGARLALAARGIAHGQEIEYRGPTFDSLKVTGNQAIISFHHAIGLTSKNESPQGFEIAGPDRAYHPATATLEGSRVMVHSPKVPNPVAVRYGWADDPTCNLYNAADLPAVPFRSDDWPGLTDDNR